MDTTNFRSFFSSKLDLTDQIITHYGTAVEADVEILLCCATSALAAEMWPGEGIDKRRFVQFLVQFSDGGLNVQKVSIPLLVAKLKQGGDNNLAINVQRAYLPVMPIVLDATNDKDENTIKQAFPSLSIRQLRGCSYASSIYTDFRSGLIHQYQLSEHLSSFAVSDRTDIPSYANWRDELPNVSAGGSISGETVRHLYFPYQYIRQVFESAADAAFNFWDNSRSWEQLVPNPWWIDV